jgi:hypothetical protein
LTIASCASGQTTKLSIVQIDSIVFSIDTTKGLHNAIADGMIRPKGKKKSRGSFSDTYLLLPSTQQLVKVEHGQYLFYTDYSTYYFFNDSLIFVRTRKCNIVGDTTNEISSGRYYFRNGVLLDRKEIGEPAKQPEAFLSQARRYKIDARFVFGL